MSAIRSIWIWAFFCQSSIWPTYLIDAACSMHIVTEFPKHLDFVTNKQPELSTSTFFKLIYFVIEITTMELCAWFSSEVKNICFAEQWQVSVNDCDVEPCVSLPMQVILRTHTPICRSILIAYRYFCSCGTCSIKSSQWLFKCQLPSSNRIPSVHWYNFQLHYSSISMKISTNHINVTFYHQ